MDLFLILLQLIFIASGVLMCFNKDDCSKGYNCVDGTCTKCLTCNLLFRKGNSCIADFGECGDCLDGYDEISITDFSSAIKPCKPVHNVAYKECTSSNDCPPETYCSEDSCIKCFDCAIVNRLSPVEKCAKGLNECGSCMDGFSEVAITTGTNSKLCEALSVAVHKDPVTNEPPELLGSLYFPLLIPLLGTLLYIFALLLRMWHKAIIRTNTHKSIPQVEIHPSAPPLCVMDLPETNGRCHSFVSQYNGTPAPSALLANEQLQKAKVFREPTASYYTTENEGGGDPPPPENNSWSHPPPSCASALSAQQQPPYFSAVVFRVGLDGVDTVDSINSTAEENEVSDSSNDSVTVDSVPLDVGNAAEVVEPPAEDTTDPLPVIQNSEQGEV